MVLLGFDGVVHVKLLKDHVRLAHERLSLLGMSAISNVIFATLSFAQYRMILIARGRVNHHYIVFNQFIIQLDKRRTELIVSLNYMFPIES